MQITVDSSWLMPAYVVLALSLHCYVAWKVRRIAHLFLTPEGMEQFAVNVARSGVHATMRVPGMIVEFFQNAAQRAREAKEAQQGTVTVPVQE